MQGRAPDRRPHRYEHNVQARAADATLRALPHLLLQAGAPPTTLHVTGKSEPHREQALNNTDRDNLNSPGETCPNTQEYENQHYCRKESKQLGNPRVGLVFFLIIGPPPNSPLFPPAPLSR